MPADWLNTLVEWAGKHLSWRWVFSVCCTSCLLLFLPQDYLGRFGLLDFTKKYHVWFGLTFLVTLLFLFTYPLAALYESAREALQGRRILKHGKEGLRELAPDEKRLLARFVQADGSVIKLNIMSGTVRVLSAKGFIFQAANLGRLPEGFPYKIQPWVLKYLKENPHCLAQQESSQKRIDDAE